MTEAPAPIRTHPELEAAVERLRRADWFALDTEFIRETTYWPRLCLVQVANEDDLFLIDPLALDDLGPLFTLLDDPGITKVLHAAGQDLEIFHHLGGRVPQPVFDTQLAAPLLGFPEQAGFARLVEALLGVQLAKGHARTDWAERPLPAEALEYAADDVRYLVPLYQAIHAQLAERGRLDWLAAEHARLTDAERYAPPTEDAWRRLKGVERLSDRSRAVAQSLAQWREERARADDVPRGRVLRDDALVDIARALPNNRKQLGRLRSLRGAALERHGDRLLSLVADARDRAAPPVSEARRRSEALDEAGEALVDALSAVVRLQAARHELNPATLADRKTLTRIAGGEPVRSVLGGWRAHVAAEPIESILSGAAALAVDGDELRVVTRA